MNDKIIINGLALAGALLVLLAVTTAASTAFADEATVSSTAVAIHTAADESRSNAVVANREAAQAAADSIALDNRLDLDFRLLGHNSNLVARSH